MTNLYRYSELTLSNLKSALFWFVSVRCFYSKSTFFIYYIQYFTKSYLNFFSGHLDRNNLIIEPKSIKLIHSCSILRSDKAEDPKKTDDPSSDELPEIKELKATIEELQSSSNDWKTKHDDIMDKYRRSIAESDNMRKRLTKQIEDAKVFGIQGFSKDLLEVADVLDKAVSMGIEGQSAQDLHQGLQMTQAQLGQVFKRHGLEAVNPIDEKFDPNKHEALFQIPVPDKEPNTVIDVQKVGYALHGRTIRPALVGVSKK